MGIPWKRIAHARRRGTLGDGLHGRICRIVIRLFGGVSRHGVSPVTSRAQKRQTARLDDRGTDGRLDERLVWVSSGSELRTREGKGHSTRNPSFWISKSSRSVPSNRACARLRTLQRDLHARIDRLIWRAQKVDCLVRVTRRRSSRRLSRTNCARASDGDTPKNRYFRLRFGTCGRVGDTGLSSLSSSLCRYICSLSQALTAHNKSP